MTEVRLLHVITPSGSEDIRIPASQNDVPLTDVFRHQNLALNTRCGGRGLCHGCTLELLQGSLRQRDTGELIHAEDQPVPFRSCLYVSAGPATIRVPGRSLLAYEPQVVMNFRINVPRADDPLWQVLAVDINAATSISAQVQHQLSTEDPVELAPGLMPPVASCYAIAEYMGNRWMIGEFVDHAPERALGLAVDIGTTTVAMLLVDLAGGQIVAHGGEFNRQMHLGDDVLTRINLCLVDPSMVHRLQALLVDETMRPLLDKMLTEAGAGPEDLKCISVAGNSTMLHLFAGVNPGSMGTAPFTPTFLEHRRLKASQVGLQLDPAVDPAVHLLPGSAAYVGADLTCGIIASGLVYDEGPSLLVDVGTNGEIIFKHGDRLFGCATAAGPAFEGAGLTSGMRAGEGAIGHIRIQPEPWDVQVEVIEQDSRHLKPLGICGSAYVDFLAEGRKSGLLSPTGRFNADLNGAAAHLDRDEYGRTFRVATGQGRQPITISEPDLASLLQAKAAIAAGILTLLERVEVTPAEVKTLFLAGGFGLHLSLDSAIGSGLLPDFNPEQVQVVGNTSLAGAFLALLDSTTVDEMERVRRNIEVIELNLDPNFESRYIDQLCLP